VNPARSGVDEPTRSTSTSGLDARELDRRRAGPTTGSARQAAERLRTARRPVAPFDAQRKRHAAAASILDVCLVRGDAVGALQPGPRPADRTTTRPVPASFPGDQVGPEEHARRSVRPLRPECPRPGRAISARPSDSSSKPRPRVGTPVPGSTSCPRLSRPAGPPLRFAFRPTG